MRKYPFFNIEPRGLTRAEIRHLGGWYRSLLQQYPQCDTRLCRNGLRCRFGLQPTIASQKSHIDAVENYI